MKYRTKDLYIVRPGKVIFDNTNPISEIKNNVQRNLHVVKFEKNPYDVSIAVKSPVGYNDFQNNRDYFDFSWNCDHFCEEDYYIGLKDNDIILLIQYLWERKYNQKFTEAIKNFSYELKPSYDTLELLDIYNMLQKKITTNAKIDTFTLKRKYITEVLRQQIYTDVD